MPNTDNNQSSNSQAQTPYQPTQIGSSPSIYDGGTQSQQPNNPPCQPQPIGSTPYIIYGGAQTQWDQGKV